MTIQNIELWLIEATSSRKVGTRLTGKVVDLAVEILGRVVREVEQSYYTLACLIVRRNLLTGAL